MHRAFLSSTFEDLKEHRRHVIALLRAANFEVNPMEDWGAAPEEPKTFSRDRLAGCDLVILLVAFRRGHVPEGEALSITQLEYQAALDAGCDVLVYMLDENAKWFRAFDEIGTDAGIGAWRAELRGRHGVGTFDDRPDSIRIGPDLARWLQRQLSSEMRGDDGALSRSAGAIAKLPPEIRRFVVRREYFGSLVYDRELSDYIAFDREATGIFEATASEPFGDVADRLARSRDRAAVDTFGQLLGNAGLLDKDGYFEGEFLAQGTTSHDRLSAPIEVFLSCTAECNFSCPYCHSRSGQRRANELTTREIIHLLDEMAEIGCFKLSLGGGEPLLRQDLPQIIAHANRRMLSVSISTNAAIVSDEVIDSLRGLRIDGFKISLPGATEATNDLLRATSGALDDARAGIQRLKELGSRIRMHTVLLRSNVDELEEIAALSASLGVTEHTFGLMIPAGRGADLADQAFDAEEADAIWSRIDRLAATGPAGRAAEMRIPLDRKWLFEGFGCNCGQVVCHVDPQGNVAGSGPLQEKMRAGNIRKQSLRRIWSDRNGFSEIEAVRPVGNPTCNACENFGACRGGCRARALWQTGNLAAPDPSCLVASRAPDAAVDPGGTSPD